ncbi:MAG: hypothetical protein DIJKHBIC_04363 [Thermoanaerobaculia bacterium]|nr:hypothetical protein [Thermoanaerobaculia bacterium]
MREIRPYGSEGGGGLTASPYPYGGAQHRVRGLWRLYLGRVSHAARSALRPVKSPKRPRRLTRCPAGDKTRFPRWRLPALCQASVLF